VHCDINENDIASNACPLDCKNHGKCVFDRKFNQHYCDCSTTGYDGELCTVKIGSSCDSTYSCLNGGTCLPNGQCLCAPGYSGDRCQIATFVSQCGHRTCQNGGTCVINNDNQYECMCTSSHTGRFCEIMVDVCTRSNPCLNGGTCKWNAVALSHTCTCPTGLTGRNCEDIVAQDLPRLHLSSILNVQNANPAASANSLTSIEILLVVCLGLGLPIVAITILFLICKIYTNHKINNKVKKLKQFTSDSSSSSPSVYSDSSKHSSDVEKQIETKDKDVETKQAPPKPVKNFNFIENNLFSDDDCNRKEKYSMNKKINLNMNSKVVENEIYLNFHSFEDHVKQHKPDRAFDIMASIV
jgi:hypothetical protein